MQYAAQFLAELRSCQIDGQDYTAMEIQEFIPVFHQMIHKMVYSPSLQIQTVSDTFRLLNLGKNSMYQNSLMIMI